MWITWITSCITLFLHIFIGFLQWITFWITLLLCLLLFLPPDILCMLYILQRTKPRLLLWLWAKKNSYHPETIAILRIYELENSSYTDRTSVIYIRELDTAGRCTCMNDRAAADINSNVTTVAYNISRLCIRKAYLVSDTS